MYKKIVIDCNLKLELNTYVHEIPQLKTSLKEEIQNYLYLSLENYFDKMQLKSLTYYVDRR